MFVGYSGHRLIACLLLLLVIILASWRFWDRSREKDMLRGPSSGELNPKHDEPIAGSESGAGGADD